jgi:hypothetical protein
MRDVIIEGRITNINYKSVNIDTGIQLCKSYGSSSVYFTTLVSWNRKRSCPFTVYWARKKKKT